MKRILGVDLDGVVADFHTAFLRILEKQTGRPASGPVVTWDFARDLGYTDLEIGRAWQTVHDSDTFWERLPLLPEAPAAFAYLRKRMGLGDDVYFVTNRQGEYVKHQTERWLTPWISNPTVLLTANKGLAARVLEFTHYIDDLPWNCEQAYTIGGARVCLMDRPWNRGARDSHLEHLIPRVSAVAEFAE